MKLISKLKDLFKFEPASNFTFECINCGQKFDGSEVEYFIKHQIDEKHYDARKLRKYNNKC